MTHPNALREQTGEVERLNGMLGNLLARIHRDGGHHQTAVGTETATQDAETEVVRLIAAEDAQAALLAECREAIAPFARIGQLVNEYDEYRRKSGMKPASKTAVAPDADCFRAARALLTKLGAPGE